MPFAIVIIIHFVSGLKLMRLAINSHRCCYGKCTNKNNLTTIPKSKRFDILHREKLFISKQSFVCPVHLNSNDWQECRENGVTHFTEKQSNEMFELLNKKQSTKIVSLKSTIPPISAADTGISPDNFNELLNSLPSLHQNLKSKAGIALQMYFLRLKRGDHLNRVEKIFGVTT